MARTIWKDYCQRTGKLQDDEDEEKKITCYRSHYYSNPCIPEDFSSIQKALNVCSRTSDDLASTVFVMPGLYKEKLKIRKSVCIKAAKPRQGATICWDDGLNEPCLSIKSKASKRVRVEMQNLNIWHSTRGTDIWGGNCAIHLLGTNANLILSGCSVESESGRGIVVNRSGFLRMRTTTIHDCAATGLYIGDAGTVSILTCCNIVRNGGGSRRIGHEYVPSGHSGIYVENAAAAIDNCLISGNSLSGISVVRQGTVRISDCDITENEGGEPVLTQDQGDQDQDDLRELSTLGGVLFGPLPSNSMPLAEASLSSMSSDDGSSSSETAASPAIVFGGLFRRGSPFDESLLNRLNSEE